MIDNVDDDNENETPYIVTITCPFCSEVIVTAYDFSKMPEDMDEEEWEEVVSESIDGTDGECEHLAFRSDWTYTDSEVLDSYVPQMMKLAEALSEDIEDDADAAEMIGEAIYLREVDIAALAEQVLPEYDFASSVQFVEKFDGEEGGGPTYMHIFLKEK